MISDEKVLELTEPVAMMYEDIATELMINIGRHLRSGDIEYDAEWKIKKLSEMGRINDESVKIIAKGARRKDKMIRSMLAAALGIAADEVDKHIAGARGAGVITTTAGASWQASEKLMQVLDFYVRQAEEDTNLVNTVMLESSRNVYAGAINYADEEMMRKVEKAYSITNATELEGKLNLSQRILNAAAGQTVTGAFSRQDALMKAINKMVKEGITGYIDRGGHKWAPEAYVNMDIRTTVHNTAIFAQKERAAEYGVQTFQISTKNAARPLCYPYQGWICSWNNVTGTVYDFNGNPYPVHAISETSYGQPAGIFGINCGHFPETFISGYSFPRYNEPTDEKENSRQYELSQEQRSQEREIRQYKTLAATQEAAGNKEAAQAARKKASGLTVDYKNWCATTGRTPRIDRLRIATQKPPYQR